MNYENQYWPCKVEKSFKISYPIISWLNLKDDMQKQTAFDSKTIQESPF